MEQIDYGQLTTITIIVLFLIKEMFSFLSRKKNGNGNCNGFLKEIKDNHLKGIEEKLDEVQYLSREADKKLGRIIEILIELKEKSK